MAETLVISRTDDEQVRGCQNTETNDGERCLSSMSFVIDFGDGDSKKPNIPPRLLKHRKTSEKKLTTNEELQRKQEKADERRNDYERAKIERIKERSEECRKIDSKIQKLLAQDAKRKGLPGTENIKPMSSREVAHSIRGLVKDFSKITSEMSSDNMT